MSIELIAKCARCGDMVPFSSGGGGVPTVPGVIFCRIGQNGVEHYCDADVFSLCCACRDEVLAMIDIVRRVRHPHQPGGEGGCGCLTPGTCAPSCSSTSATGTDGATEREIWECPECGACFVPKGGAQ